MNLGCSFFFCVPNLRTFTVKEDFKTTFSWHGASHVGLQINHCNFHFNINTCNSWTFFSVAVNIIAKISI